MHRIRLAGPWQALSEPLGDSNSWVGITLPYTFESGFDRGNQRVSRKFHAPSGINDATVLRIAVEGLGVVRAYLNGTEVVATIDPRDSRPDAQTVMLDITGRLRPFNELQLELESSSELAATVKSAELQIG